MSLANRVLRRFGFQLLTTQEMRSFRAAKRRLHLAEIDLSFLLNSGLENLDTIVEHFGESKAQLRQDLFVLSILDFPRDGFFVEFGATNGLDLSNTYMLEKGFGWTGILAEPGLRWHNALRENRNCIIDARCVWSESGRELEFEEAVEAELSSVSGMNGPRGKRSGSNTRAVYPVITVSLQDLLKEHRAPKVIDYMSVDTEGSESLILEAFDFETHRFRVITVEHNFRPSRERIFEVLSNAGYQRVAQQVSRWDDWYVSD